MPKVGQKIVEWDECEIAEAEVKHRLENWQEYYPCCPTEKAIQEKVYQDNDLFAVEWESLIEFLNETMDKKNTIGYWKVIVNNFGWRNLDGYKCLHAENGKDLIRGILPDCDCTFRIFNYGKGLAIQNFHHDSPTGNEWYYLMPISEKTYVENR
ncbi:MAG: hypothetical protein AABX82_08430 [Nanoarchaeota archaeon]